MINDLQLTFAHIVEYITASVSTLIS